jgi:hypothetical protein
MAASIETIGESIDSILLIKGVTLASPRCLSKRESLIPYPEQLFLISGLCEVFQKSLIIRKLPWSLVLLKI